jgi:hypothetical protein
MKYGDMFGHFNPLRSQQIFRKLIFLKRDYSAIKRTMRTLEHIGTTD